MIDKETSLLVGLQLEQCPGGKHAAQRAEFLTHEGSHLVEVIAMDHDREVIVSRHKEAVAHLGVVRNAACQAVKSPALLRTDPHFNQRGHATVLHLAAVHHRLIPKDDSGGFGGGDTCADVIRCRAEGGRQFTSRTAGVGLE